MDENLLTNATLNLGNSPTWTVRSLCIKIVYVKNSLGNSI